jgi:ABC-type bacteriocin/lantibiotic exporter with double-glycine peptidase domain
MPEQAPRPARTVPAIPTIAEALKYLWRVVRLMRPYWRLLAKGAVMGVGVSLMGMLTPYLSKLFFDRVYPAHDVTLLQVLVIGGLVLTTTSSIMASVKTYFGTTVAAQLNRSVSLMFFNHLQHLTVRFFDQHRVGEINSRFANVSGSVQTVSRIFETVVLNGTFLILVPPVLFFMSPKLALLALITTPVTTAISTVSSRWLRRFSKQSMEASAEISAFQIETLSHIRTVKGLAAEPYVFRSANEQLHRTMELQLKAGLLGLGVGFANTLIRACGYALFSYFAWMQIIRQEITLGDFMAFSMYLGYLSGPIGTFASLFVDFQSSAVSFERMFEYLDLPVEQDPTLAFMPQQPIVHRLNGGICLTGVSFGYSPEKRVLHDVSLHIAPGSLNAIVGSSGAGKSSLLRLLCGLERPQAGDIRFGDFGIDEISLPDLRRQIAVVWQEFSLMRGTILENLTYALDDVPASRVDDAIRVCRLVDVIADLPNGLDTTVAEWGATLSGGQRQRMAIARALIRGAPILLRDEATSNIDANTEGEILRDVFSRAQGTTVVYVTHRVLTAALADRIFVLDAGRLVGAGSHAQLMEENDAYRDLYAAGTAAIDDPRRLRVIAGETALLRR